VGALWSVDAFFRQHQSRDRNFVDDVRLDDFPNVFGGTDSAIPDGFGINDHSRAVFALIQASGAIGTDRAFQSAFSQFLFEKQLQGSQALSITTATRIFRRTLVDADKNVLFKLRHIFLMIRKSAAAEIRICQIKRRQCASRLFAPSSLFNPVKPGQLLSVRIQKKS
jgi:hypothetical protein